MKEPQKPRDGRQHRARLEARRHGQNALDLLGARRRRQLSRALTPSRPGRSFVSVVACSVPASPASPSPRRPSTGEDGLGRRFAGRTGPAFNSSGDRNGGRLQIGTPVGIRMRSATRAGAPRTAPERCLMTGIRDVTLEGGRCHARRSASDRRRAPGALWRRSGVRDAGSPDTATPRSPQSRQALARCCL
jgi:hypothetical protein